MIKDMEFYSKKGEWALVIGASTGYGEGLANECAKKGFNIIVCARRLEKLQDVTAKIREKYGVETREFVCDISREDAPEVIMNNIEGLDLACCIYNAAVENAGTFIKMDLKYHMAQIMGNVTNPTLVTYNICRLMAKKHRGYMLLCGSIGGSVGTANSAVYSGCKAYMNILGETLWYEMSKFGVYVASVTIGAVVTPTMNAAQEAAQEEKGDRLETGKEFSIPGIDFDITPIMDYVKAVPHTPEVAAEATMANVGKGPRQFSHPLDEKGYYALQSAKREISVQYMGKLMDAFFTSGTSYFDAPDAGEFTEI